MIALAVVVLAVVPHPRDRRSYSRATAPGRTFKRSSWSSKRCAQEARAHAARPRPRALRSRRSPSRRTASGRIWACGGPSAETAQCQAFYALQDAARGYAVIATDADGDLRALSPGAGAAVRLGGRRRRRPECVAPVRSRPRGRSSCRSSRARACASAASKPAGVDGARRTGRAFDARLLVRMLRGHGDEASGFLLVVQDCERAGARRIGARARRRAAHADDARGASRPGVARRPVRPDRLTRTRRCANAARVVGRPRSQVSRCYARIATSHVLLAAGRPGPKLESGKGGTTFETDR